ncbi:MAG: hypothetical protein IJ276_03275 [Alphaproteobacteria bacterium]|nr:hypothetical protein [Alphaproteobacteria bacterium]
MAYFESRCSGRDNFFAIKNFYNINSKKSGSIKTMVVVFEGIFDGILLMGQITTAIKT